MGARVPLQGPSVELKHRGLRPEQHPRIEGTSLLLDVVSPLLDGETERAI